MDAPKKDGVYSKIQRVSSQSYNHVCSCDYGYSNTDSTEKNIKKKKLPRKLRNYLKGMVFINGGCTGIHAIDWLSPTENDTTLLFFNHDKKNCTNSFLLDEKEVTNKEYKEFVNWVKDSLVRTILAEKNPTYYSDKRNKILNWEIPIDWSDSSIYKTLYFKPKERFYRRVEFNTRIIIYKYIDDNKEISINVYPDTSKWIKEFRYSFNEPKTRMYFWHPAYDNYPVVGVTFNQAKAYCHWKTEQLKNKLKYFKNFSSISILYRMPTEVEWEYAASGQEDKNCLFIRKSNEYPWTGEDIINDKGKYYANFGTTINENGLFVKSHSEDGFFNTSPVGFFPENDFGLYDMAGNIAEWTEDKPYEISLKNYFDCYPFRDSLFRGVNTTISDNDNVHSLLKKIVEIQNKNKIYNENIDTIFKDGRDRIFNDAQNMLHDYKVMKKFINPRIVKGGSWADPLTYLLICMNQVFPEDSSSCKIGFRLAMSVPTELIQYFYSDKYFKNQNIKNKKEAKTRKKNKKRNKFNN